MSSLITTERARRLDEGIFYSAFGGALAVAVSAAATAAGRYELALTGAGITVLGALVSWGMRGWPTRRALHVGLLLGALAGSFWLWRCGVRPESLMGGDFGRAFTMLMTVPLVALSFVLVRAEVAAFALVPGFTALSLAASQGDEYVARAGFTLYLPLALLAVGYAMLFTGGGGQGLHRVPRGASAGYQGLPWSVRHWPLLGGMIAVIMLAAQGLYYPLRVWAENHRWQLITAVAVPGGMGHARMLAPRGEDRYVIGQGPMELTKMPVLSVVGEYASYWRGEVYDTYYGSSWGRSMGLRGPRRLRRPWWRGREMWFSEVPQGRPTATYQITAEARVPLIFYAPGEVYRVDPDGSLRVPRTRAFLTDSDVARVAGATFYPGSRYAVTAGSFESAVGRTAPAEAPDDRYLSVPLEGSRVAEVARQVAGSEPSPQKKMAALIGYLQTNCKYNLQAPAIPPGQDAVEYFVLGQKEGYCDLFASALAVMGRAVGVPTRVVTGYAFPDPPSRGEEGYTLTEADGHAWVEAYFPDAGGWTTLDATPAAGSAAAPPSQRPGWLSRLPQVRPWLAAVAVLLAGGLAFVARTRLRRRRWEARPGAARDWRAEMTRLYLRLAHLLRRRGYPRAAAQTPFEYLARLEQEWTPQEQGAAVLPLVRNLTEGFVAARYGPGPVREETARAAQETLAEIGRALTARPRR